MRTGFLEKVNLNSEMEEGKTFQREIMVVGLEE